MPRSANPAARRSRPPFFTPVKLRARKDGWSPQLQCAFLAELYLRGSVAGAAKAVGKSRESAYRLRAKRDAQSFAAAWDHVLGAPGSPPARRTGIADWRKVTLRDLYYRVEIGLWQPVIYRGTMRFIAQKPDNSALLRLLRRLDAQRGERRIGLAKAPRMKWPQPPGSVSGCFPKGPPSNSARVMT